MSVDKQAEDTTSQPCRYQGPVEKKWHGSPGV
jgi:hypothetical protein